MDTSLKTYRQEASDALRAYLQVEEEDRTDLLRQAADALVGARALFYTADGSPDWRGRSYAYRRWVGDVYTEARIPREDLPTIQASVRYHVGNALRERLSSEELAEIGLRPVGPRERSVEKRTRQAHTLELFEGGPIVDAEDAEEALVVVARILRRIDGDALRSLPAARRREIVAVLTETCDTAEALKGRVNARRKR